ncbi:methyl-accepting chemotaxis protein [Muricoccus nepalensis]|nr:methyl-accepting chemotaxis protein [Roseomonas nepalensis]
MRFFGSGDDGARAKAEWLSVLDSRCGVGLWDAILHEGDAMHAKSRWTWSSEFRRLLGFRDAAEFPDVVQSWSERLHPEDAAATFAAFGRALETGELYDVTYRLQTKDGSYRWFRATGGVLKDEKGVARRACGSLTDIHEAREAEAARAALTAALMDRFRTEVQDVVAEVAAATARLQADAEGMARAAARTAESAGSVSGASGEASANVASVAAATEEMTASIREITGQMTRSTEATAGATAGIEAATGAVHGLVEDVRRIGDVVGLISTVAGQTNLLALNATIEAARAGEAGRGFAVVASEVKTLAAQTAKATDEITGRIQAIQAATDGVERAIGGVAATIGRLNEVAAAIAAAVEQQGATTSEIARSIQYAAQRSGEVTQGIGAVNGLATEAGAASARITEAARGLSGHASTLRGRLDGFLDQLRAA